MIQRRTVVVFFFIYAWSNALTQSFSYKFNNILPSQNTNAYVYVSSGGLMMISSIDGLNIFDGLHVKVYRPLTHNMRGSNIQSTFFEDTSGNIWFTTYEALHRYNPIRDQLDYWYLTSSNGDTLKENYKAFYLHHNSLYLKAGEEVLVFDVASHNISAAYSINFSEIYFMTISSKDEHIILFGGSDEGYFIYELGPGNKSKLIRSGDEHIRYVSSTSDSHIWIGYGNGELSLYNPHTHTYVFRTSISGLPINGITNWGDSKLFLTASGGDLLEFSITDRRVTQVISPVNLSTREPVNYSYPLYISADSTLCFGGNGQGVFFSNFNKQKFKHLLEAPLGRPPFSVAAILQRTDNSLLALTHKNGIILMDQKGNVLNHWTDLPSGIDNFTAKYGVLLDDDNLLFCSYYKFYLLSISANKIIPLSYSPSSPVLQFDQIHQLEDGTIITCTGEEGLFTILLKGGSCILTPFTDVKTKSKLVTQVKSDYQGNLYISNDEINILVYAPSENGYNYAYTLPIKDGVLSIVNDPKHNAIYITNYNGIYYLNLTSRQYIKLKDRNNHLQQTIYAGMIDHEDHIWLSSNTGLMKYIPNTNEIIVFSKMDGLQASEFNSNAYLKTENGTMMFGGINGINVFHPGQVRLSKKEVPIYISEVLINDERDTFYKVPQYIDTYILPYHRNTISFEFHAIDYADPDATRVRYKLDGVDDEYVESKTPQGFTRYANLEPGEYTLSLLGRNSDGTWNESPRELPIIIHPPFWLTWWFISLSSLTIISLLYWSIRSYYRRKLEKKNLLLHEQALIIKNQQAIEHERTRIASEMHDDLGSGLTTIRYLSDKALMQAKDTEEAEQIQRIADHSNTLVRNMSEIIWAMNSRFDDAENLAGYLRRYASEYLEEHKIPFTFDIEEEQLENVNVRGEVRRNLFLVFKEVLHNTVKYSRAHEVIIQLKIDDRVTIKVSEMGAKGFDPISSEEKGNGLYNIKKRIDAIEGQITYEKTAEAMHINFSAPIHL